MRISTAVFITVSLCLLNACGDEEGTISDWNSVDCETIVTPDCWHANGYYCATPELDLDGDGYCGEYDCNEEDPRTHFMAIEIPDDEIDQDCDGADWSLEPPESLNP